LVKRGGRESFMLAEDMQVSLKRLALAILGLAALSVLAEGLIRLEMPLRQPGHLFAQLFSLALALGVFTALTDSRVVKWLRHQAVRSTRNALTLPLLLLLPYFIEAFGAGKFSWQGFLKLTAYILVPTLLLLPDRLRTAARLGWRDCAAMLALGVPVPAGWLQGIWFAFGGVPFFRPLYSVCIGGYAFLAIRNLQDVGYRLLLRKQDLIHGLAHFVGFALVGIPLGYALHFTHFHNGHASVASFAIDFIGVYITIAIPEEFLFRGILQNFLEKSFEGQGRGRKALIIASVIFGASHFHHPPVPNWKYCIMATLAGLFYGNAYRERRRLSASAFTHALVDATWHFWF
jgi:membrane protease YdiL (CAAX protease family)